MKTIIIRDRFVGYHKWPDAPDEVKFLREKHRHEFHIEMEIVVRHGDREKEFFISRRMLKDIIHTVPGELKLNVGYDEVDLGSYSCEMLAQSLMTEMNHRQIVAGGCGPCCLSCAAFEDGENGGKVYDTDLLQECFKND